MESKCSTSLGQCSNGGDFFRAVGRCENLEVQLSRPYELKSFTYVSAKIWGERGNCVPCTPGSDGPVFDYDEIICDYTMQ